MPTVFHGIQSRVEARRIISFKAGTYDFKKSIPLGKMVAAMATIDAEIAQIVTKLAKAHSATFKFIGVRQKRSWPFFCVSDEDKSDGGRRRT